MAIKATAQITIKDLTDIYIGDEEPDNPYEDQLWLKKEELVDEEGNPTGEYLGTLGVYQNGKWIVIESSLSTIEKSLEDINSELSDINSKLDDKVSTGSLSDMQSTYNGAIEGVKTEVGLAMDRLDGLDDDIADVVDEALRNSPLANITFRDDGMLIAYRNEDGTDSDIGIFITPDKIIFRDGQGDLAYIAEGILHFERGIFSKSVTAGKHKLETLENSDISVFTYVGED